MSTIKTGTTLTTAYQVEGDTTGALVIQTGASPTTAVTIGSDQSTTLAGTLNLASQNMTPYTGFKNRIINGAMMIDQRNAGASYAQSTSAIYGLDRWKTDIDYSSGRWDVQQVSDAPTGFTKSLKVTITTQEAQPASALNQVYQIIEGYNVADLAFGTASASTIAVSFWVKASVTGTYSLNVFSVDYGYTTSYVVNSANTWEFKTVTIAGATAGTWATDNTSSMYLEFTIGGGTSQIRTANTWGAQTEAGIVSGSVYLPATSGATWQVTGVQLEKGSTATSFDYRPYGTELNLCQRYYQKVSFLTGMVSSSTTAYMVTTYGVTMRANPTVSLSGALAITDSVVDFTQSSASISTYVSAPTGFYGAFGNFTGLTPLRNVIATQGSVTLLASAEL